MIRARAVGRAGVAALAALLAATARGQSYGPGDQVLTIGAAKFRSVNSDVPGWMGGADGYLSVFHPSLREAARPGFPDSPTNLEWRAPLPVPAGARIRRLCMWAHDTDLNADVLVDLIAVKLTYAGEDPASATVGPLLSSTNAPGYRSYCADLDLRVTEAYDVDGDATLDPVAWYVRVREQSTAFALAFGGVTITWRREVSDPPGTPTFGDVPDTHPFYRYVEALSASGITGGCASGNYCPDAPLTRGQMAVFVAKALGLNWGS